MSDGRDLALALAPQRSAILNQLMQYWRPQAAKNTSRFSSPQRAAEAIGAAWFDWLDHGENATIIRTTAIEQVRQGLTYSTGSTLVQTLTQTVRQAVLNDAAREMMAQRLLREFSSAFLEQVARQQELRARQDQERLAVRLQVSAGIVRVATSILDPDQLLAEIVKLIAVRFGFYHAAVFTIDDSGRWALIRDASGEVGQQLVDRGQALAIRGQSIVGTAIRERQPQIALDAGPAAVQFNDPLLPNTRSEMALPLIVGDQVLGALDLHSTAPAAFDDNFAALLQGMVDQIAIALHDATRYQREQAHAEQTNRLMQIVIDLSERTDRAGLQTRLVQSALTLLDTDRAQFWLQGTSGLELKATHSVRPGADQSLAISQELAERACSTGLSLRLDSPPLQAGYASRITDVPFNAALITPISWQGRTIGVLSVMRSQPGRPFTQDDETAAQLLAAQAATALENITLAEQQQQRTLQLQTAAEVSRATATILQVEELLATVVELVRDNFGLYYVGIFLLDAQAEWADLRAGTGEAGRKMLQAGHRLRIDESSMIGWSIVHRQARIALDVGSDAVRFDNPLLPNTRSEMALPLISRGNIIGAATIQSTKPAAFTSEDITILQTMADQITTAAENARLFERTQAALNDTQGAQRLLSTLIDNIPYPIFYKDTHGAYLGCNRAFEQYVGRDRREFMGKTAADVYADPVMIEKYQTMDQALFDQPGTQVYEMQVKYADSVLHDVIFNKATFTDTAGQLAGLVGTMIDITERKHAETVLRDSEAQLSEALRMARLGYWEYNVDDDLFLFNDQFYSIFHTTAEQHGGYQLSSAYYAQHFVHPDDLALVGSEIQRALNSTDRHYSRELEHRILYADGGVGYISVRLYIDRDEAGQILRYYGANQDITERKLSEETLKETEERFRVIAEATPLPILISSATDGTVLYGNEQLGQTFGIPIQDLIDRQTPDFYVDPADRRPLLEQLQRDGALQNYELHVKRADGTPFWVLVSMRPMIFANQRALFAAFYDITERKLADEILHQSEAQLSEALRIAQMGNWTYDVPTDTFTFNDQFYALMRTTVEQEGSYTMSSAHYTQRFVHPEDAPMVGAEIGKALETTDPNYRGQVEHRIYYADGELGYIMVRFTIEKDAQGRTVRTHGANQDITTQRQIELDLAQERNLLRTLIDALPERIFAKDTEGRFTLANVAELQGDGIASFEELRGKTDFDFYPPELAQQYYEAERSVLSEGKAFTGLEERSVDKSGRIVWHMSTKVPLRNVDDQIVGLVGMTRNITEQKEATAEREQLLNEVQRSEQLMRTVIDSTPDWIFIKDQEHRYQLVNQGYANSLHIPIDHFIGRNDLDLGFPEDLVKGDPDKGIAGFWADDRAVMDSGKPKIIPNDIVTIDGAFHTFHTIKTPLRDAAGNIWGVLAFGRDISEREQLLHDVERRANQVEAVAEVGAASATILETQSLLESVVQLTQRRFNLYHCHIFLLDDAEQMLAVRACGWREGDERYGTTDERVIRLDAPQSLVAQAARTRQPVIVNDVRAAPGWLPNPALPHIQSEMALPMIVGNDVLGVFNVHSEELDHFTEDDARAMFTLATQVAIALQNARLFEQAQRTAAELNALNRQLTGEAWHSYVQARSPEAVIWHANDPALSRVGHAQAEQLATGDVVVAPGADRAEVSVPVMLRGQLIGALRFRTSPEQWTDEAQAVATSIAGHIAQAVENTRLIEQTQQTAQREKQIAQAADRIHRASDLEAVLRTALEEVGRVTGAADVSIQLGTSAKIR